MEKNYPAGQGLPGRDHLTLELPASGPLGISHRACNLTCHPANCACHPAHRGHAIQQPTGHAIQLIEPCRMSWTKLVKKHWIHLISSWHAIRLIRHVIGHAIRPIRHLPYELIQKNTQLLISLKCQPS